MARHGSASILGLALRRCRRGLLAVVIFSFAVNLLMLTAPLYMLQVFDRVLTSRSIDTLLFLTLVAGIAFLTMWALEIARGRLMIGIGTWLDRQVSGPALESSVLAALGRRSASTQAVRDVGILRTFLTGPAVFPIMDAPWTPLFIAVVFLLHPLLGWIGIGGAIVLFAFALANDRLTRRPLDRAGQASGRALGEAEAAARNADVVEAMGMRAAIVDRWHAVFDHALADQARASRRSVLITATSKMLRQALQVGVLGVGAWLVLGNELTPGGMIAASILVARALAPVEQAIGSWRTAVGARSAYRRLGEHLQTHMLPGPAMALPAPKGALKVEGVSYAHPGEKEPLLRGIGFALEPGESLGMVGPTAAGKTTLARLLVGNLRPQLGHVRLDGADVAVWNPADRGRHIGYLPQDVELFNGTVRDNIARLGEAEPDQVVEAAQLAGAHEMILTLPQGYESEIGLGGMALSGGQRQRIALARAAYGDPKLVVLDEPNANLDQVGESALLSALNAFKQRGASVVIIAHRPTVLSSVDKILVLRDGQVHLFGPRDEVLKTLAGGSRPKVVRSNAAPEPSQ